MIALDTNALSLLFVPGAVVCKRGTNMPIKHAKERVEELIRTLSQNRDRILISTPTLSEFLVKVPPAKIQLLVNELQRSANFKIQPFDTACAVELADRTAAAIASPQGKRAGTKPGTEWAKVKFDRQIMAVAITSGASMMISNDEDLVAIGKEWKFPVMGIEDLPLPESHKPPPIYEMLEAASEEGPTTGEAKEKLQIEGESTE